MYEHIVFAYILYYCNGFSAICQVFDEKSQNIMLFENDLHF